MSLAEGRVVNAMLDERKELLIVDDHWPSARIYARVLAPLGIVVVVGTVDDAVRWVDEHHQVAAIVCEVDIPLGGAARLHKHLTHHHAQLAERLVMVSRKPYTTPQKRRSQVFPTAGRGASQLLRRVLELTDGGSLPHPESVACG